MSMKKMRTVVGDDVTIIDDGVKIVKRWRQDCKETVSEKSRRSISTWDDLTTCFLAQFFPPGRNANLRNDILMFQQNQYESLFEAWTRFKHFLPKVPHHGIFYDHVNHATRQTIDQSVGGKLHDKNFKESWALLEDLALYENESWNDPRDFAKPVKVKAISSPQDVPSTSDRHLIELKN
nr:zinc finger, CCHC-type [Tanacetum cinerariifolium]